MRTSLPPGPPRILLPLLYGAYAAIGEPVLDQGFSRYGKSFTLTVPSMGRCVMLADPELIEQVIKAAPDVLDSTEPNKVISVIYGTRAIVVAAGADHRRLRKVMLPPMRGGGLQRYRDLMTAGAERTLDRLPLDEPLPLLPELHAGTLEVILEIVLGLDRPEQWEEWIPPFKRLLELAASEEMVVRHAARKVGGLRTWRALHRTLAECDRLIYDEIARRRTAGVGDAGDMLSLLVGATTEGGDELSDVEIRDNVVNLLVAGHETSATGLAWAFHWILRDAAALERLVSEARTGTSIEYASAVAREAIRLCPPFAGIARRVVQPFRLGEHLLPAGTTIVVPVRHLHRDPTLYEDPDAFRPERFLGANPPPTASYLSFGAGLHRCLGDQFAVLEIALFLHALLRRATFEPADPAPETLRRKSLVNVPSEGCRVRLTSRDQLAHASA